MEDGWFLLETAHALAHLRGDPKWEYRKYAHDLTKTAGHFIGCLGEVIFCYAYDLPIDVGMRVDGLKAEPDNIQYGIEIRTSSRFNMPFIRLPWTSNEAPRIDMTLAVVDVGVYIQPHPYGFTKGTMEVGAKDHWACMPTIVTIAGWEAIDFMTHQTLASVKPSSRYVPVCYTAHPADLLPPDTFWAYLELARQARGNPVTNERYRYLDEWMGSEEFAKLIEHTPPLPCRDCIMWNHDAEGKPKRPRGQRPKRVSKRKNIDWWKYDKEVGQVYKILKAAGLAYEAKLYRGERCAKRLRNARGKRHRDKMSELKKDRHFAEAKVKVRKGKRLTNWQKEVYRARMRRIPPASVSRKDEV
jgi:hypothetical protein